MDDLGDRRKLQRLSDALYHVLRRSQYQDTMWLRLLDGFGHFFCMTWQDKYCTPHCHDLALFLFCRMPGYDLAILDELSVALFFGLIERKTVENFLDEVPQETEVVITGRNAPDWLVERADLVTDMREVKHYYANGVAARRGIED